MDTPTHAMVPWLRPGAGPPAVPYAVITEIDREDEYRRLLPLVKWLAVIPHFLALMFIFIGALFALIAAFFAVLFTGRFPEGLHRFVTGTYRWWTRVNAYALLMTDRYPPFSLAPDEDQPARFDVARPERIAHWRPLVHWLLVIPYAIVAAALMWVAQLFSFLALFAILFTKRFPPVLFDFNVVAVRWQNRSNAYLYFMTDRYPPWDWG